MYDEYNFSPSTQWAAYRFSDYRQRIDWQLHHAPTITVEQSHTQLSLVATINMLDLPANPDNKPLRLGLTAVIKDSDNQTSFWALNHPTEQPDFHNNKGFILTL